MCSILKRKTKFNLYCKRTKKKFRKNSDHVQLDFIENFIFNDVSDEYLNDLINELITNKLVVLTKQNTKFESTEDNVFLGFKTSKINKLLKARENQVFPSDYIHCLIANHVYFLIQQEDSNSLTKVSGYSKNRIKIDQLYNRFYGKDEEEEEKFTNNKFCDRIWQILEKENWEIYEILRLEGYQSIIYINEIKKQIVLAFQGFKFRLQDLFFDDDSYLKYIDSLFHNNDLILNHLFAVYAHVRKAFKLSQILNYTLSFTSYSFGSIFSDFGLFILNRYFKSNHAKSVTFESIGSYDFLTKLNDNLDKIDLNDLDINTYLIKPTFLNTLHQHLGTINFCTNKLNKVEISNKKFSDFIKRKINQCSDMSEEKTDFFLNCINSLRSTNLKNLLKELKDNSDEMRETQKWPILSFKTSHSNSQPKRSLIRIKKKTFEKYFQVKISKEYLNSLNIVFSELKSVLHFTFKLLNKPSELPERYFYNFDTSEKQLFDPRFDKMNKEIVISSSRRVLDLKKKYKTNLIEICKKLENLKNSNFKSDNLNYLDHLVSANIDSIKRSIKSNLPVDIYSFLDQKNYNPIIIWLFENNSQNTYFEIKRLASKFNINLKQSREEIIKEIQNNLNEKYKEIDFFILISDSSKLKEYKDFFKGLKSNCFVLELITEWLNCNQSFNILNSSSNNFNFLISKFIEYEIDSLENDSANKRSNCQHLNNFIKLLIKRNFKETKDLSQINHLIKYYFDLFTFVQLENKKGFDFMFYLCYLDSNNINLKLLKNIFNLIDDFKYYDLVNEILNYLIEISFLVEINEEKYLLNEYYKNEFLNRIYISNDLKTNIMNKIVNALVNLILKEDYSLLSLNDIEIFYKQSNVIKNIDWYLKESNLEYQQLLEILDYIDKNYFFEMINFDQFHKIESNNINELISNKSREELNLLSNYIEEAKLSVIDLKNFLNGLEAKLYDDYIDLVSEIQLRKELRISEIKEENNLDQDEDEFKLTDSLKCHLQELDNLSEILIKEIEKYRNNDIEKLNNLREEIHSQIDVINEYFRYISSKKDNNNNLLDNLFAKSSKKDQIRNVLKEISYLKCIEYSDIKSAIKIEAPTKMNNPLGEISIKEELHLSKNNYFDFETEKNFLPKSSYINHIIFLPQNRIFFDYKIKLDEFRFKSFAAIYSLDTNSLLKKSQIHFVYKQWLKINGLNKLCLNCYKDTFIYDYDLNKIKKIENILIKGSSDSGYYGIHCNTNVLKEFNLEFDEIMPNARFDEIIKEINRNYFALYLNVDSKNSRFILNLNLYTHYRQLYNNCLIKIFNDYGHLIFELEYIDSCSIFFGSNLQIADALRLEDDKKYYEVKHYNYDGNLIKKVTLFSGSCDIPDNLNATFDSLGDLVFFRQKN